MSIAASAPASASYQFNPYSRAAEASGSAPADAAEKPAKADKVEKTEKYDPADLNKDGIVTAAERRLYAKMNPGAAEAEASNKSAAEEKGSSINTYA